MARLVENDPLVMEAVAELRRFASDLGMQELERRRKLWRLEYHSGLTAATEEGVARGEARGRVLAILQTRFRKVPTDVEKAVRAMVDLTALKSLAVHAETCQSLEEFAEVLK